LRQLVERTRERFGFCILLDCHSMPSVGGPLDRDHGQARVDFVLGDCFGTACAPAITEIADRSLSGFGYLVTRNDPYAGGFTTRHYGRPGEGLHALQIEINRSLYMDEDMIEPRDYLRTLAGQVAEMVERLGRLTSRELGQR
jgi:N-formylglutamate amidohydrolase